MENIRLDKLPNELDEFDNWIDEGSAQGKNTYSNYQSKQTTKFENDEDWEKFLGNDFRDHDKKRNYSRDVEDKLIMRRLKRELYDDTGSKF
jgi:hypothetical protein